MGIAQETGPMEAQLERPRQHDAQILGARAQRIPARQSTGKSLKAEVVLRQAPGQIRDRTDRHLVSQLGAQLFAHAASDKKLGLVREAPKPRTGSKEEPLVFSQAKSAEDGGTAVDLERAARLYGTGAPGGLSDTSLRVDRRRNRTDGYQEQYHSTHGSPPHEGKCLGANAAKAATGTNLSQADGIRRHSTPNASVDPENRLS